MLASGLLGVCSGEGGGQHYDAVCVTLGGLRYVGYCEVDSGKAASEASMATWFLDGASPVAVGRLVQRLRTSVPSRVTKQASKHTTKSSVRGPRCLCATVFQHGA